MSRSKRAKRRADRAPAERSVPTVGTIDGGGGWDGMSGSFGRPNHSGEFISPRRSLTIMAVWGAVNVYCNAIGVLDLYVAEKHARGGFSPAYEHPCYDLVHSRPNRNTTSFNFRRSLVSHALTRGNGYAFIERGDKNRPRRLHLMDPRNVTPTLDEDGSLWYRQGAGYDDLPAAGVIHVAGLGWDGIRGYCPITLGSEALGLATSREVWEASLMGNSAMPSGHLEMPGNVDETTKGQLVDAWNRRHKGAGKAGGTAVLSGGVKWVTEQFSPVDAQLILGRNFSIAEIARMFNLPQHMLGLLEHATFSNIEEQNIQFYQLSLLPWLTNIEQELNSKLFSARERPYFCVRHNVETLLRANLAAQTANDQAMFDRGVKSINDIRLSRGMNPLPDPGADKHWVGTNNLQSIEDLDKVVAAPPAGVDPDDVTTDPTAVRPADDDAPRPLPSGTVDSLRAAMADPIGRMIRRECEKVRRASRRGDFSAWISGFYADGSEHSRTVAEAVAPMVRLLNSATGSAFTPEEVAASLAEESRGRRLDLYRDRGEDEVPGAAALVCDEWESGRAEAIAERLVASDA